MRLNRKTRWVIERAFLNSLPPDEGLVLFSGGRSKWRAYRADKQEMLRFYRAGELDLWASLRPRRKVLLDAARRIKAGTLPGLPWPPIVIIPRCEQWTQWVLRKYPGMRQPLAELLGKRRADNEGRPV